MRKSMKLMIYIMRAITFGGIVLFMGTMALFCLGWDLQRVLLGLDTEVLFAWKILFTICWSVIGSGVCINGMMEMTKMEE